MGRNETDRSGKDLKIENTVAIATVLLFYLEEMFTSLGSTGVEKTICVLVLPYFWREPKKVSNSEVVRNATLIN